MFQLGTRVYFAYRDPIGKIKYPKVILFTQNYMGNLHGLKVENMTAEEQMIVLWFFDSAKVKNNESDPIFKFKQDFEKRGEEYEKRRQEIMQRQQRVVIKPDTSQTNKTFGVKTFGTTPTVSSTPNAFEPSYEQGKQQPYPAFSPQEHDLYKGVNNYLNNVQQQYGQNYKMQIPRDPYSFYHGTIKSLFGKQISRFYRKYSVESISGLRAY